MKKITVLSGKGGVGKSSITASLAVVLSKKYNIIAADCDVDASNLALVFGVKKFEEWKPIATSQKAKFDLKKCISCKKCAEACYFNAIEWQKNKPKLKKFGCEGCGVCKIVCPSDAVRLVDVNNAKIGYGKTKYGFNVVSAQLEVGEAGSGKVVVAVRNLAAKQEADIMLIDSAAGIGCPVIASVAGADYVIAVTEPTPSALSDLSRALEMVNHFKIPAGIVINKYDINKKFSEKIEMFAKKVNVKVLAKIAYNKKFVEALVSLTPIVVYDKSTVKIFEDILNNVSLIQKGRVI